VEVNDNLSSTEKGLIIVKSFLLSHGIVLPSNDLKGRKGGAGPSDGQYFILNYADQHVLANIPVYPDSNSSTGTHAQKMSINDNGTYSIHADEFTASLEIVPSPNFYSKTLKAGNTPMKAVALAHGDECLATTIHQNCIYWRKNLQCSFCGIEYSMRKGTVLAKKRIPQFLEVLDAALSDEVVSIKHLTLTTGSLSTPDRGASTYMDLVKEIKNHHEDLPVHVQFEPPENLVMLEELRSAGVDTVGIHLETYDETIRRKYCPGKAVVSRDRYFSAWDKAIEIFGENQVDTFLLAGLGESRDVFLEGIRDIADRGVIPFIVPVRSVSGSSFKRNKYVPDYKTSKNYLADLFLDAMRIIKSSGLKPEQNLAGCVRCGGCSVLDGLKSFSGRESS